MTPAPATDVRVGEETVRPAPEDERFWSVTTMLDVLDKPALLYWAAEQAAEAACDVAGTLARRIDEDGREAVVKWLRDARFRTKKGQRSAADLGTAVHDACQEVALTGSWPEVDEEVRPFVEQADRLLQRLQPTFLAAEAAVYNRTYGYAGTLDAIAEIEGQKLLLDWKTSRKDHDSKGHPSGPYPEHALQLAAYRHAELLATWRARRFEQFRRRYYLLNADERELGVPMPAVDGGLILHLTPGHGNAHPMRCDEAVFESFLFCLELTRWSQDLAPNVVGPALAIGGAR